MAGRALAELETELPDLKIAKIDVTMHPMKAWQEGVRMIPCLTDGDKRLSGIMLSKEKIRAFISQP